MSTNVFTDLGYADADERAQSAVTSHAIATLVRSRQQSAADIARLTGVSLQVADKLYDGLTGRLSLSELRRVLAVLKVDPVVAKLDRDVRLNTTSETTSSHVLGGGPFNVVGWQLSADNKYLDLKVDGISIGKRFVHA